MYVCMYIFMYVCMYVCMYKQRTPRTVACWRPAAVKVASASLLALV